MTTVEQAREDGWGDRAEAFVTWKAAVNKEILIITEGGCDSEDIPDWDYASAFVQRVPAKVAARRALRAADFPFSAPRSGR